MDAPINKRTRLWASLLAFGAAVILYRTLSMIFLEDALTLLMPWVIALLFLEMAVDALCLAFAIRWAVSVNPAHATLPLRLGAVAAILHAFRVLIYVLGRTGPWVDFDRRPEFRGEEPAWFWVVFAAILSVLGIVGVVVIWRIRKHRAMRAGEKES
jgi:hypothetical protein